MNPPNIPGMTLRDWYIGMALVGKAANSPDSRGTEEIANAAMRIGDAALQMRNATQPKEATAPAETETPKKHGLDAKAVDAWTNHFMASWSGPESLKLKRELELHDKLMTILAATQSMIYAAIPFIPPCKPTSTPPPSAP